MDAVLQGKAKAYQHACQQVAPMCYLWLCVIYDISFPFSLSPSLFHSFFRKRREKAASLGWAFKEGEPKDSELCHGYSSLSTAVGAHAPKQGLKQPVLWQNHVNRGLNEQKLKLENRVFRNNSWKGRSLWDYWGNCCTHDKTLGHNPRILKTFAAPTQLPKCGPKNLKSNIRINAQSSLATIPGPAWAQQHGNTEQKEDQVSQPSEHWQRGSLATCWKSLWAPEYRRETLSWTDRIPSPIMHSLGNPFGLLNGFGTQLACLLTSKICAFQQGIHFFKKLYQIMICPH